MIVNETMAQRYWPNRDPIGTPVNIKGDSGGPAEVIAIARNSKYGGMEERPLPFLYRSYDQGKETGAALFVETDGSPENLTSAVRTQVHNVAPNMPIFDIRTMQDHFQERGLLEQRFGAQVFTALGVVGLVLGVLGLYGVIAYSVQQRTYEIGIRMAVGASNRQILRMVLLQGLRSSGVAAGIGICLALASRGVTTETVSYVNPYDPNIPARRASMVDPNVTLRG